MSTAADDESETLRLTVDSAGAGQRADVYLASVLTQHSRSYIKKLIDDECVTFAHGGKLKANTRLVGKQELVVVIPEAVELAAQPENIPLSVLYEDGDMIVLDKPAGMVVHPSAGHETGALVNGLLYHCGDLSGIGGVLRPGIVHRLDMDTSGVIAVAKHDIAHRGLSEQFFNRTTRKTYIALCHGTPKHPAGTIAADIGRNPRMRHIMAVVQGGREAVTDYEVTESFGHMSLVTALPKTGRTHQIRVHLAHIGVPILADPFYGTEETVSRAQLLGRGTDASGPDAKDMVIRRHMLHARRLEINHPVTGERKIFDAPIPPDMQAALDILRSLGPR